MTDHSAKGITPVLASDRSTVIAEYKLEQQRETTYQSEDALEQELIRTLCSQGYQRLTIHAEDELIVNLRRQLELLNEVTFSDAEWDRFFKQSISSHSDNIVKKTKRIQEAPTQSFIRDDGSTKNIKLIDKRNLSHNRLQVLNQYEVSSKQSNSRRDNRYDVTILVNGLPLVHIELKKRGVNLKQAFFQINRYQRDSFWAGSGLFEYVQIFVISNGTRTKYYSNTTRDRHVGEVTKQQNARRKQTSNSFEFTSWWADAKNNKITDLIPFSKTFLARNTILNILTKFCVFDSDNTLLVMRPYQIVATERILQQIEISANHKLLGTVDAGGYVWHTTGSGKTLTSFKTAQLATATGSVSKVIFVVDRQDLDYQTMKEYDRFAKGAANGNNSTAVLRKQLGDPKAKIIVTTIQKLSHFVKTTAKHRVYDEQVVLIFDECHRSQFGEMHAQITKAFKKYNLFGFTGTPIFAETAPTGGDPRRRTTEQVFGYRIHAYTIVDAIQDGNVLKFLVDHNTTVKAADEITDGDKKIPAIDRERIFLADERISLVVDYILNTFATKTKRRESYLHKVTLVDPSMRRGTAGSEKTEMRKVSGFNALFATASIAAAKKYYSEFKKQQADGPVSGRLKVGVIYSYSPNENSEDGYLESEIDAENLDTGDRDFLDGAISDYNEMFSTNFSTSGNGFEGYYRDLSMKLKNREIDLVIVVNMFLTGFDATTLNTLYVDKNLRHHGLIQAFSRTNRILNSIKSFGHIVTFRNLEEETNDALALFGNKEAQSIVVMRPYSEYLAEYKEHVGELIGKWNPGDFIAVEDEQAAFVKLFSKILRVHNILESFEQFEEDNPLSARDMQDYQSMYLELYDLLRKSKDNEKTDVTDDLVFEIELVQHMSVDSKYIIDLIQKYREQEGGIKPEQKEHIKREVDSAPGLRAKRDLIEEFVEKWGGSGFGEDFYEFAARKFRQELDEIIAAERMKREEAYRFVESSFREGEVTGAGTAITRILPPVSRFSKGNPHGEQKERVIEKLEAFLERFREIIKESVFTPEQH